MGMKRRGLGRRQVLNLNDKQDSPRRTWQTKYQQICAEHNSQNGDSPDVAVAQADKISPMSGKSLKNNPLSGLLGQYHSDSDTEDDSKKDEDQLNSKVSDFLKEIQTIAPAEYAVESPVPQVLQPKEAEFLHPHLQPQPQAQPQPQPQPQLHHTAVLAWQECYDENSGYVYYWNMETNEVTWEMPPEYQAYMAAMAAQEQHMGMMHSAAQAQAQALAHAHAHAQAVMEPERARLLHTTKGQESPEPLRKKCRPKDEDSDDERIEMITSYGPASDEDTDDDDDDEILPPVKRRRGSPVKSKQVAGISVGSSRWPDLPVMGPVNEIATMIYVDPQSNLQGENGEEPVEGLEFEGSTLLSNDVPDMGAPGEEDFREQESMWSPGGSVIKKSTELPEVQNDDAVGNDKDGSYPIPDSSEDNSIVDKGTEVDLVSSLKTSVADSVSINDNVLTHCRVSQLKTEELDQSEEMVAGSGTSTPIATTTEGESDDVESGETDEGVILSRLRSQARILKELGGEIPDEIQHLIEPATTDASPIVVEDVIAQIEKELPPDYVGENKEKENNICKKKLRPSGFSNIENSPRSSSFALIAGYGDDSDPEDDKKPKRAIKISNESKKSKLPPEHGKLETDTLISIADQSINQKVKLKLPTDRTKVEPTPIFSIVEQTETQKMNLNLPTEQSKVETSPLFPISDQALNQKGMLRVSTEQINVETSSPVTDHKVKLCTVVLPVSVTTKESNLVVGPVNNIVLEECTSHDTTSSLPYAPLFPTAVVADNVPESTRPIEPCIGEHLMLDSTSLPDSTTCSKIIKRKKRLDIGGVFPVTKVAVATTVQGLESKKQINEGIVYSLTKSAATTGLQAIENKSSLDEGVVYSVGKATATTTMQIAEGKKGLDEGGVYSMPSTAAPTTLQISENNICLDEGTVSSVAKVSANTMVQVAENRKHLDESAVYSAGKAATTTIEQVAAENKKCVDQSGVNTVSKSVATTTVQGLDIKCEKTRTSYSAWSCYNSDPISGERRGFGFQSMQDGDTTFFSEGTPKPVQQKKGIINFVKAETLNLVPKENQEMKPLVRGELLGVCKEEIEAHQHMDEMAMLISEKVSFLAEGKEPVSPVLVMAIQIETLVSAWHAGALAQHYWSHWLANTTGELARLEQAAAPDGWACEWDREYKRYYYRNELSGETQWEYPSAPEEDAMELCTTPPPPPAILEEEPPRTPPPPLISAPPSPPPPLPPRISTYQEKINSKLSSQYKKKKRNDGEVTSTSSDMARELTGGSLPASNYALPSTGAPILPPLPPLPPPPPPPPPSELPPLPPSSPPPAIPTPPLPTSPPPSLHRHDNEHGEPLPPGVDPPELPYIVARPPMSNSNSFQNAGTVVPPPPPPGEVVFPMPMPSMSPSPPDSTALEVSQMMTDDSMVMGAMPHPLQGQFVMSSSYQQAQVVSSSIPGMAIEYGPVPYVAAMPMHMAMPAVIAKPPAKKSKSSLHDELDSFYSDLASLESTASIPPAALEPPVEAVPVEAAALPASCYEPGTSAFSESEPTSKAVDAHVVPVFSETRRKKKPKLAPGLALKKKGVSSLVAKWQQVQQEVRRDYKSLDDDDGGVSSTHK